MTETLVEILRRALLAASLPLPPVPARPKSRPCRGRGWAAPHPGRPTPDGPDSDFAPLPAVLFGYAFADVCRPTSRHRRMTHSRISSPACQLVQPIFSPSTLRAIRRVLKACRHLPPRLVASPQPQQINRLRMHMALRHPFPRTGKDYRGGSCRLTTLSDEGHRLRSFRRSRRGSCGRGTRSMVK